MGHPPYGSKLQFIESDSRMPRFAITQMVRKVIIVILLPATIATLVLWVGSYWNTILWRNKHHTQLPNFSVVFDKGICSFAWSRHVDKVTCDTVRSRVLGSFKVYTLLSREAAFLDEPAGFRIRREKLFFDENGRAHWGGLNFVWLSNVEQTNVTIPFWFLFALFLIYPGLAFIRGPLRRRRRRRRGQCMLCGYNLTSNTSGVCPECGQKVSAP